MYSLGGQLTSTLTHDGTGSIECKQSGAQSIVMLTSRFQFILVSDCFTH